VPQCYFTLIARAEPENSILDVVRAFSAKRRGSTLAVLGNYDTERNAYHRAVRDAASDEVRFLGAIYDKAVVQALRFHCAGYIHGHQVGGTNPSLVEALGASNPVLAHDNRFNRWVAGPSARYFRNATACAEQLDEIVASPELRASMRAASRTRFLEVFTWPNVLDQYEQLLARFLPA
jgi:glycosyltransferase involved in cell wall biosynthesis